MPTGDQTAGSDDPAAQRSRGEGLSGFGVKMPKVGLGEPAAQKSRGEGLFGFGVEMLGAGRDEPGRTKLRRNSRDSWRGDGDS
jgi:hypothetical protein